MKIQGKIVHGRGVGKQLGFPTANIEISAIDIEPGVWACLFSFNHSTYPAVANIGSCPTFGVKKANIEVHVIGLNEDIYETDAEIKPIKKLREIRKFSKVEELTAQITKDVEKTKEILSELL